jgi:hypothetical protein
VPCGQRQGRTRGYPDRAERWQKQRRLAVLHTRLADVEERIQQGRPAIVVGGRRLAKVRHSLADAQLTETEWHEQWEAARLFLTADGESAAPYGNYTITVHPETGEVSLVLPDPLRHLANAPRGRYKLGCAVGFSHRRAEWLNRACAHRAVRYDIVYEPDRGRWYIDASWSSDTAVLPSPQEIRSFGERILGVDLNLTTWPRTSLTRTQPGRRAHHRTHRHHRPGIAAGWSPSCGDHRTRHRRPRASLRGSRDREPGLR